MRTRRPTALTTALPTGVPPDLAHVGDTPPIQALVAGADVPIRPADRFARPLVRA